MTVDPRAPAFPSVQTLDTFGPYGLTRRELFAAMAMQGLAASPEAFLRSERLAQAAVELADATLAALASKS